MTMQGTLRDFDRRLGRFEIDTLIIDHDPARARLVLNNTIPLHVLGRFDRRCIEYVALHPAFDLVPLGAEAPKYKAVVSRDADGSESVTWQRDEGIL